MQIKGLIEQRAKLIADARALIEADTSAEAETKFDAMMAEVDSLRDRIERRQRLTEAEESLDQPVAAIGPAPQGTSQPSPTERAVQGFNAWLRQGSAAMGSEAGRAFAALQADSDTQGGYMVAPMQVAEGLIQAVDNQVFVRQRATVLPPLTSAHSLGVVTLDADPADADWTSELGTGAEDSTMAFGQREMTPHPVAKRIKISQTLLRKAPNIEAYVQQRLAYKFAVTLEKAYMTGTGAQQPLGLFTPSDQGIGTARDVSVGNTTTEIKADNLMEVKYSVKGAYYPNAAWVFHRDAVKRLAKLKDGDGRYLWQGSLSTDRPDTLLGHPVFVSEYAPSTFTTGLYVGLFGDISQYQIVDSLQLQIQRLVELYAATNQIGYIGRFETDGQPVLAEAFARVKLA